MGWKRESWWPYIPNKEKTTVLFPLLLKYIIPEAQPQLVMGSAFANSGSVLELAGSVGHEGSFCQLAIEATPCSLPADKTLPCKPIACADQLLQLWLGMVWQEGRRNKLTGCGGVHKWLGMGLKIGFGHILYPCCFLFVLTAKFRTTFQCLLWELLWLALR